MSKRSGSAPWRRAAVPALAPLALLCGLQGCAAPPPYTAVNHQRFVPLTSGEVWRREHAFLQDEGISVVSEDAAFGLIDARQAVSGKGLLSAYADCGERLDLLHPLQRQTLNLTIRIVPTPDGAQVVANATFSQTLRDRRSGALTVACRSNGVLEDAVLNVASGQPMEAATVPQ